jgi:branched-chain amino acid transport system substrate-binding protein
METKMKSTLPTGRTVLRAALPALLATLLIHTPAQAEECTVKLGVAGPMTGAAAAWGLALKSGTEFEAAWANSNGGVQVGDQKCKVTVTSVDALSTAAGGAAASNSLASQGVHLIIGPVPAPEAAGFKPVAKRNNQLFFTTTFAADAIGPDYPLGFQNQLPPAAWAPTALKLVKDRFNLKTVVVVGPNDQGGTDPGNALLKYYDDVGIKASTEWYQRGTMNFAAIATRVVGMNPDAIELGPMPPGEATVFVKQLKEAGYKGVFGRMGTGAEQIIKGLGGEENVGTMYSWNAVPTEDPGIQKLNADYQRVMKSPIPANSILYCAQLSTEQILRAVTRAGTADDVEKIAAELRKVPPQSRYLGKGAWRGKAMYGSNQQLAFPIGVSFIVDGKKLPQVRVDVAGE